MKDPDTFTYSMGDSRPAMEERKSPGAWQMTDGCLFTLIKAGRWRISVAAALAAVSGALLRRPSCSGQTAAIFTGVLLFALACTWLNQFQERKNDSRMCRTRSRPLANNSIPVIAALSFACLCLFAALPFLFACGGWRAMGIIAVVLILYNCLYTLLKVRSLLALFPGALAGATPPVLGWVCAGGALWDPAPFTLFLLFFLWQVPHYWLAAERFATDYEIAGFPVPWRLFGSGRYVWMLALWVGAFCVALLALPAFGLVRLGVTQIMLLSAGVCPLAVLCFSALRPHRLFHTINLTMAAVCIILVVDKVYRG